jgi:hypothetical protein
LNHDELVKKPRPWQEAEKSIGPSYATNWPETKKFFQRIFLIHFKIRTYADCGYFVENLGKLQIGQADEVFTQ